MKHLRQGGFLIARIHQAAGRIFARKLKTYGLDSINPAQGRILFVLWEEDGISIQELARKTSLGKSTLTSMLDRLETAGKLKRVPSKEDRRKIQIRLTGEEKKLRDTYRAVSAEMTDLFYNGISKNDIDAFESTLRTILANLEASEKI